MASSSREEEVVDEKLYIAVCKELKACKSTILWALQNYKAKRVCLVHVHQPAQTMSVIGAKFRVSSFSEERVKAHREKERRHMCEKLDKYISICEESGAIAEKQYIEMDSIENGIVELISQLKIERLVMGAATDDRYSRKMVEPKSKKANYVRQNAPAFCHVWFICKGHLIYTREGDNQLNLDDENQSGLATAKSRVTQSTSGWSSPMSRTSSFDDLERSSTFSLSPSSLILQHSAHVPINEERDASPRSHALPPRPEEKQHHPNEGNLTYVDRERFTQAISDAEIARNNALHESRMRHKAENEAIEATRKAKASESLYLEEMRRREEMEEEVAKVRDEVEIAKSQRDMALAELRRVLEQLHDVLN